MLCVAVIVSVILLIFVIPQFESLFKGFGADLPAFTQMVVNLSRFVQHQGWWLVCVIGGSFYAFFYFLKRSRPMQLAFDRIMLKVPIIGPILHQSRHRAILPDALDHVRGRRAAGRGHAIRGGRHAATSSTNRRCCA